MNRLKKRMIFTNYIFSFIAIVLFTYSANAQEINKYESVVRTIICSKSINDTIKVSIIINRDKILDFENDFQRLVEIIPEGFIATTDSINIGHSEFKDGKLKFFWKKDSFPSDNQIALNYSILYNGNEKLKNIIIVGTFNYLVNKEKREIQITGDNSCDF